MSYLSGRGQRVAAPPPGNSIGYNQLTLAAQSTLAGRRNRFINGTMAVGQRVQSFAIGSASYGPADRWIVAASGASVTVDRSTSGPDNRNALRFTGAAGNTSVQISQRIESINVDDLANGPAVASGYFYTDTGVMPTFFARTPTATDNYTSTNSIALGAATIVSLGANWYSFVQPVNCPASTTNGLEFGVVFGAHVAGRIGALTGMQFEKGSVVTPQERLDIGRVLLDCLRYYEVTALTSVPLMVYAAGFACTQASVFKAPKRNSSYTSTLLSNSATVVNVTGVYNFYPTTDQCGIVLTTNSAVGTIGLYNYSLGISGEI